MRALPSPHLDFDFWFVEKINLLNIAKTLIFFVYLYALSKSSFAYFYIIKQVGANVLKFTL
jgi:hypothetical protein